MIMHFTKFLAPCLCEIEVKATEFEIAAVRVCRLVTQIPASCPEQEIIQLWASKTILNIRILLRIYSLD